MISIITPSFKAEKYIERCILSVQHQTYKDYEHLIIIQGDIDETKSICEKYAKKDKRIKLFYTPENSNLCINRNIGIKNAHGDYIALLDADDEYKPFYLEELINAANESKSDLILASGVRKGKTWETKNPHSDKIKTLIVDENLLKEEKAVPPCYILYKKDIIKNIMFDENISTMEDWLIYKECVLFSKQVSYIESPGYIYWDNGEESLAWDKQFNAPKTLTRVRCSFYTHQKYYFELLEKKNIKATNFLLNALNTILVGYYTIWLNTESFNKNDFKEDKLKAKQVIHHLSLFKKLTYSILYRHPQIFIRMYQLKK